MLSPKNSPIFFTLAVYTNITMNRRAILKYTTLITGVAVGAPLAGSLLLSCEPELAQKVTENELAFFNEQEFNLIKVIVDVILPKTDSPSASEVNVHHLIDHMLGRVYSNEDQKVYKQGFSGLMSYLEHKEFLAAGPSSQLEVLQKMEGAPESARKALLNLKQQTIAYYLTTETVGTKFLNYLPVPGVYEPCINVEEAEGKAWAI